MLIKMNMYDNQITRRAKMILKLATYIRTSSLRSLSEQDTNMAAGISQKK
jgi:hypothetical protein